jgi:hypothetical protein
VYLLRCELRFVAVEDFRPLIEVPIVKQLAGEGDMSSVQGTRGRLADLEARLGCARVLCTVLLADDGNEAVGRWQHFVVTKLSDVMTSLCAVSS